MPAEPKPKDKLVSAPPGRQGKGVDFTGPDGEPIHIRNGDDVFAMEGNGAGGAIIYVGPQTLQVAQSVEEVKRILDDEPEWIDQSPD